jgi:ELWxxDGT repeat protein
MLLAMLCMLPAVAFSQMPNVGLLANINPGANGNSSPSNMIKLGSIILFSATDGTNGTELWKTDGTAAGTIMVKDIRSGSSSSSPTSFVVMGGFAYFLANDGVVGGALWRTDGTAANTTLVKDVNPTSTSTSISNLTAIGSTLYFRGDDGTNGQEPWTSNGTTAGTAMLKNIAPGSAGSSGCATCAGSYEFVQFGAYVYFNANDQNNSFQQNSELWRTDGTAANTVLFKDNYSAGAGSPANLTNAGSYLFFTSDNQSVTGYEPWKTDGTVAGTTMIKDIFNPGFNAGSITGDVPTVYMNGYVYFAAIDVYDPNATSFYVNSELWRTDGTSANTTKVKEINPATSGNSADASPNNFYVYNNKLYFTATDGTNGTEPWVTDGTAANTFMLKNINLSGNSNPSGFTELNGYIYFRASDGAAAYGTELWRTDGTAAGTVLVKDINPAVANGNPSNFTVLDANHMVFSATNFYAGSELHILGGYNVTLTTGADGQVSPPGLVSTSSIIDIGFKSGSSQTFTFTPDATYSLQSVMVNGGSVGTPGTYTFSNITSNQTLTVAFGSAAAPTATHFTVSIPASTTAGSNFSATVTALDATNTVVTGYTGTVHFTTTDGSGSVILPADYTFVAGDAGVHTFSSGVKLTTAGSQSVTATDVSSSITGTGTISVTAATASQLQVSTQATATAGASFNVTVSARDQFGNIATGYTGTVSFSTTDPSPSVIVPSSYTFVAGDAGVHTFSNGLKLATAGSRSVTASDAAASISGSANVVVTAGATARFSVNAPATATAGISFGVTVAAKDAFGNTATGYTGTVHFTTNDPAPGVVLPSDYTFTGGDAGTHTFNGLTLTTAGTRTITATDAVNSSISNTSNNINVNAAAASHFALTAPSTVTAGTPFTVAVTALDQYNNQATGYNGIIHFTTDDASPSVVLPANYTFVSGDLGAHTFTNAVTLITACAPRSITATDFASAGVNGSTTTTPIRLPQGSLTSNGPFCGPGTGQLTWTATTGTGPFTVVYNDGVSNRTATGVSSGIAFNVATNPVTATTSYTLVSVTEGSCVRSSSFTGGSTAIPVSYITAASSVVPLYPMAGQEAQTIYLNYPGAAQADTIKVTPGGGIGTYSYTWQISSCNGATMVPLLSGGNAVTDSKYAWAPSLADTCSFFGDNVYEFKITVADATGCTATTTKRLNVVNPWSGAAGTSNVQICHKVPRSTLTQILQVAPSLVASHLGHGDILANCPVFIGKQILPDEEGDHLHTAFIYPNPSTGVFMLELSEIAEGANVSITDVSGKTIQTRTMTKDGPKTATFDMSSYARGVYLIQVTDGEFVYRDKIVVQ